VSVTVTVPCVIALSLIFVSFWIHQLMQMQSDAIGIAVVDVLYVGVA